MTSLAFANWNGLPDLGQVDDRLTTNDAACLAAVKEVMAQFGCLARFGVTLLHKHFEVAEDEILAEFVDEQGRRLEVKPVKLADVAADLPRAYETQWHFKKGGDGEVAMLCIVRCFPGIPGSPGHASNHVGS